MSHRSISYIFFVSLVFYVRWYVSCPVQEGKEQRILCCLCNCFVSMFAGGVAVFGESACWVESGRESYGEFALSNKLVWWMITKVIIDGFFNPFLAKRYANFLFTQIHNSQHFSSVSTKPPVLYILGNNLGLPYILLPCGEFLFLTSSPSCSCFFCFVQFLSASFGSILILALGGSF